MKLFRKTIKQSDTELFRNEDLSDQEKIEEYVKRKGGDPKISRKKKEEISELLKEYDV